MSARERDPQLRAVCLERLSSALTSAQHLYMQTLALPDPDLTRLAGTGRRLIELRLFVLLRDFVDPRSMPRHPALMSDIQPPRSYWVECFRGWRKKYPTVEWQ